MSSTLTGVWWLFHGKANKSLVDVMQFRHNFPAVPLKLMIGSFFYWESMCQQDIAVCVARNWVRGALFPGWLHGDGGPSRPHVAAPGGAVWACADGSVSRHAPRIAYTRGRGDRSRRAQRPLLLVRINRYLVRLTMQLNILTRVTHAFPPRKDRSMQTGDKDFILMSSEQRKPQRR